MEQQRRLVVHIIQDLLEYLGQVVLIRPEIQQQELLLLDHTLAQQYL
jgi:hypothetical protein